MLISHRLEKAAVLPLKPWAPLSMSQRLTPSVPCRPGETLLVEFIMAAMVLGPT